MLNRIAALIVKELLALLRDPKARMVLIAPPIVQLFVLSYAATLEVKNVDIAVLNRDGGYASHELLSRIEGSPTFRGVLRVDNLAELHEAVTMQRAIAALPIGPTFSRLPTTNPSSRAGSGRSSAVLSSTLAVLSARSAYSAVASWTTPGIFSDWSLPSTSKASRRGHASAWVALKSDPTKRQRRST